VWPRHDFSRFEDEVIGFACCCFMHRHGGSSLQTVVGYEAYYLTANGAMCCRRLDGVHSSWMNYYGTPAGCPVAVVPPRVHAEAVEMVASRSRSLGPRTILTNSAWCLCFFYYLRIASSANSMF